MVTTGVHLHTPRVVKVFLEINYYKIYLNLQKLPIICVQQKTWLKISLYKYFHKKLRIVAT